MNLAIVLASFVSFCVSVQQIGIVIELQSQLLDRIRPVGQFGDNLKLKNSKLKWQQNKITQTGQNNETQIVTKLKTHIMTKIEKFNFDKLNFQQNLDVFW